MLKQYRNFFIVSTQFPSSIFAGFGTKNLGDGRKKEVIEKLKSIVGEVHFQLVDPQQVHGDHIQVITKDTDLSHEISHTDGLITQEKGLLLTVLTADCVPIIFVDPIKHTVGISHQGWRGTEGHLAQKMISTFETLGSDLRDLRIAIGPSINQCCYPRNLLKENLDQLQEVGIPKEHIDWFPFCTKCDEDRFYSYRRERKKDFEEQMSFVMISQ